MQCVPHTYFIIALPVKLMNSLLLSKLAATKPGRLIHMASWGKTRPVKMLIITTSWKLYRMNCWPLSVTFNYVQEAVMVFQHKPFKNVVHNNLSSFMVQTQLQQFIHSLYLPLWDSQWSHNPTGEVFQSIGIKNRHKKNKNKKKHNVNWCLLHCCRQISVRTGHQGSGLKCTTQDTRE